MVAGQDDLQGGVNYRGAFGLLGDFCAPGSCRKITRRFPGPACASPVHHWCITGHCCNGVRECGPLFRAVAAAAVVAVARDAQGVLPARVLSGTMSHRCCWGGIHGPSLSFAGRVSSRRGAVRDDVIVRGNGPGRRPVNLRVGGEAPLVICDSRMHQTLPGASVHPGNPAMARTTAGSRGARRDSDPDCGVSRRFGAARVLPLGRATGTAPGRLAHATSQSEAST